MSTREHHTCPRRGCQRRVPDRLFACRVCWNALPREVREVIWATAGLPLVNSRRRWAIHQAHRAWDSGGAQ